VEIRSVSILGRGGGRTPIQLGLLVSSSLWNTGLWTESKNLVILTNRGNMFL
jgi:hypothetical protein